MQRGRVVRRERERAQFTEAKLRAEAAERLAVSEGENKKNVELLSEIGREITSTLDIDTIFDRLYDHMNELADAEVFGVGLYVPDKHVIDYRLAIERGKRYAPYTRDTTDRNQLPVWCIQNRKPVVINDIDTETTRYIEAFDEQRRTLEDGTLSERPQSLIYMPLINKDQVLGIITIQSFAKHAYTEHHVNVMRSLASYTSIAIDNAAAYRRLNQQEAENRRLFEEAEKARAIAEEADAAKSAFLSTVSHELRTPLTSVLGFAKIIKKRLEDRIFPLVPTDDRKVAQTIQQVQDNLGVVVSEGERLTKLIDDVLDLAKIEAGKLEWHMEPVSVEDIIERATAATSSLFEQKGLRLVKRHHPGPAGRDRRSRPADPGRDQPDLERGEVHRHRLGDLPGRGARRRAGRERHRHRHGDHARRPAQGVRALQAGRRHAHRQAEGHRPGPARSAARSSSTTAAGSGSRARSARAARSRSRSRWRSARRRPRPMELESLMRQLRHQVDGGGAGTHRSPAEHPRRRRRPEHPRTAQPGVRRGRLPGADGAERARGDRRGAPRTARISSCST